MLDDEFSFEAFFSAFSRTFSSFSFRLFSSFAFVSASRCACFSTAATLATSARCRATFCTSSFSASFACFASIFCDFLTASPEGGGIGASRVGGKSTSESWFNGLGIIGTEVELADGMETALSRGC